MLLVPDAQGCFRLMVSGASFVPEITDYSVPVKKCAKDQKLKRLKDDPNTQKAQTFFSFGGVER